MTHEQLLEAYNIDEYVRASDRRIKKLLSVIIVLSFATAFILLVLYLCTTEATYPALRNLRKLILSFIPIFFVTALILAAIRLLIRDKPAHYVDDAHERIYHQMISIVYGAIDKEGDELEGAEIVLDAVYQKYIKAYLFKIFADGGKITDQSRRLIGNYAYFVYDTCNYELSYVTKKFMNESYS